MKVGLTQMDIVWENKAKNMEKVTKLMEQAKQQDVELLVFPEMTLTGFTMNTAFAGEEMLFSETLQFFKDCSRKYEMAVAFGFVEDFGEEYYNKLMIVSKGRIVYDYDKIHPFNYGEEGKHYIGGHEVKTTNLQDVCLSGFVCYDLRFPEIFQAVADQIDVILVIANWPKERVLHWETLLRARAIENQCYVVGVNRVGRGSGQGARALSGRKPRMTVRAEISLWPSGVYKLVTRISRSSASRTESASPTWENCIAERFTAMRQLCRPASRQTRS